MSTTLSPRSPQSNLSPLYPNQMGQNSPPFYSEKYNEENEVKSNQSNSVVQVEQKAGDLTNELDQLVDKTNGNFIDEKIDDVNERLQKMLEKLRAFSKRNLSPARASLCKYCSISGKNFPVRKGEGLDLMSELLENDSITTESSADVIDTMKFFLSQVKPDVIQGEVLDNQKKIARTFAVAVELTLRHYSNKNLNSIQQDLKDSLAQATGSFKKLNKQEDPELNFLLRLAKEAVNRLQSDLSSFGKLFNAVISVGKLTAGIYNKDLAQVETEIISLTKGISQEMKASWFSSILAIKEIARNATTDLECLAIVQTKIYQHEKTNWKFLARSSEILAWIATNSPSQDIRKQALFGVGLSNHHYLKGLSYYVRYSKGNSKNNLRIRILATKSMFHFINDGEDEIRLRVKCLLIDILESDTKKEIKKIFESSIPKTSSEKKIWLTTASQVDLIRTVASHSLTTSEMFSQTFQNAWNGLIDQKNFLIKESKELIVTNEGLRNLSILLQKIPMEQIDLTRFKFPDTRSLNDIINSIQSVKKLIIPGSFFTIAEILKLIDKFTQRTLVIILDSIPGPEVARSIADAIIKAFKLERKVEIQLKDLRSLNLLATALSNQNAFELAAEYFESGIQIYRTHPDIWKLYNNYSTGYASKGDNRKALELLHRSNPLKPVRPNILLNMKTYYMRQGKEMESDYNSFMVKVIEALKEFPHSPILSFLLAEYHKETSTDKSVNELSLAWNLYQQTLIYVEPLTRHTLENQEEDIKFWNEIKEKINEALKRITSLNQMPYSSSPISS